MHTISKKQIASGKWIALQEITYLSHDNTVRTWEAAFRVRSNGAVMMIPIFPDGSVIVIRQYRPPTEGLVYEFPAGLINPGEDPVETAVRELKEETGYDGVVTYCTPPAYTSPGLSAEFIHVAMMKVDPDAQTDLKTHFDDSESIETFIVPPSQFASFLKQAEADGIRVDSKIYTWFLAHQF